MRQLLQQLMRLWDRATPAGRLLLLVVPLVVVVSVTQRPPAPFVTVSDSSPVSDQVAYQRDLEQHLGQKAQSQLDRVLSPGSSVVRVNADIRFQFGRETAESLKQPVGSIERLSVTVMVTPRNFEDGQSVEAALGVPLANVEALVKQAVGFQTGRDALLVTLGPASPEPPPNSGVGAAIVEPLQRLVYPLALAVGALALLVFVLGDSRRENIRLKLKTRQRRERTPAAVQPLAVQTVAEELAEPPIVARPEPRPPEYYPPEYRCTEPAESQTDRQARSLPHETRKKSGAEIDVTGNPAEALRQIDSTALATALQHEHPRAVAIALRRMESGQAAEVMQRLSPSVRQEAFSLMAQGEPEHAGLVQRVLQAVVETCATGAARFAGGSSGSPFQHLADVLQAVSRDERRELLATLELSDAPAFAEVESRLYDFSDGLRIEHRSRQKLLAAIDLKVLAIALCGASPAITEAVLGNITERVRSMLHQEVEFAQCVSSKQVEAARREIAEMIREFDKADSVVWLGSSRQ